MKNKTTLRWIGNSFKRYLFGVVGISVLGAALSAMTVLIIMVSREIINNAQAGITGNVLKQNIALLCIIIVLEIVMIVLNNVLRFKLSAKMDMHLKKRLFKSLINKNYSEVTSMHSGELMNRFTSDIDIVVSGVAGIFPSAVATVTKLFTGVGAVLFLEPIVAIVILFIGFVIPLFGRMISKKYKYLHKETQRTNGIVRSFLQESAQNIIVIKTFLASNPITRKLSGYLTENYKIKRKRNRLSVITHAALFGSFSIGYYGVLIWGALGIANGTVQYGTLFAFLQLVSLLRAPLQNVSGIIPQYYTSLASAERLMEIEGMTDEAVPSSNTYIADIYENLNAITAKKLSFSYGDRTVIKDSNFSIKRGSICAIVGESGAGKSTLLKLLLGLYSADTGSLVLECKDKDIPLDSSVRGLFAYVPQGSMIISGTIRENLTFLSGDISEEKLISATKQAMIYDFISSLPDGFDTAIGERGLGLSEGQLQRIAICRALLNDSPILLLDECTSALDNATETALLKNLKAVKDKTVILITHRTAALDICDSVINVKDCHIS